MSAARTVAAVLGLLSALALILVMFMPWGSVESSGFGANVKGTVSTWNYEQKGSFGGFEGKEKAAWFSDEVEEDDGANVDHADVVKARIGIPCLLLGLLLVALSSLLAFMGKGPAPLLMLLGGLLVAAGTVLFALATDHIFDSDQDWGASFYLAIASGSLALVGGVIGMAGGTRSS